MCQWTIHNFIQAKPDPNDDWIQIPEEQRIFNQKESKTTELKISNALWTNTFLKFTNV